MLECAQTVIRIAMPDRHALRRARLSNASSPGQTIITLAGRRMPEPAQRL